MLWNSTTSLSEDRKYRGKITWQRIKIKTIYEMWNSAPKIENFRLQRSFHLAGSIEGTSLKGMIHLLVSTPTVLWSIHQYYLLLCWPCKTMQQRHCCLSTTIRTMLSPAFSNQSRNLGLKYYKSSSLLPYQALNQPATFAHATSTAF